MSEEQKTIELAACPFCGGENTQLREHTNWTGQRSVVYMVEVMHWCDDQIIQNLITRKAKTSELAIKAWNTRTQGDE